MHTTVTAWSKPITIRLQNGLPHTFAYVEESLDFLEHEWPINLGAHRQRALELCKAVRNHSVKGTVAREQFIAACLEAGMPQMLGTKPKIE
jgi:hypothetical protein